MTANTGAKADGLLTFGVGRLMRTGFMAVLASVLLVACKTGGTRPVTPTPERPPAPPAVLRLADAYVASLAGQPSNTDDIRKHFISSFFDGFTMPGATMSGGTEAGRRGFVAGQEYRRTYPRKVRETMEGFGYTPTEAEGTWTVFFEHSGFRPRNQPEQTWWLSYFGDTRSDIPQDMKISGIRIRVTGYLGPSGHFGHLNNYDHEFFATTISRIHGDEQ